MAGRLIDLADPSIPLPNRLVFDASVIIDWLLAIANETTMQLSPQLQQAHALVDRMHRQGGIGFVTSTSLTEIHHFLVKPEFRALLPRYRADILARYPQARRPDWSQLYKVHPELVRQFLPRLDEIRRLIIANDLLILQPQELAPIRSDRSLEESLLQTMARYALDSSDAAIVMEARRAGLTNLVTSDRDLWRASSDMDVYTWPE
jgi:predicted nucleic acid-binding protein